MSAAKPLQGHLLIASPHLSDPNFFRSVVLMVQHDSEGAFGLILNRPLSKTIEDVWELISDEPCESQQRINYGGPVEGPLTAIHADALSSSESEVAPGVHFSPARENIAELFTHPADSYLLFVGYAGWGSGQLEAELEAGGWLRMVADKEIVFGNQDEMWKVAVERIGLEILEPSIKARHIPRDPAAN